MSADLYPFPLRNDTAPRAVFPAGVDYARHTNEAARVVNELNAATHDAVDDAMHVLVRGIVAIILGCVGGWYITLQVFP